MARRQRARVVAGVAVAALAAVLAAVGAEAGVLTRPGLAALPINRWPMIQAHDCATGYLEPTNVVEDVVYAWTKTQESNVTSQLQCGARSFDWRPAMSNGSLVFHHGPITIPHSMKAAAQEIVDWAGRPGANQTEEELVLLSAWDCVGESCNEEAIAALRAVGIPVFTGDTCSAATNWTLAAAMAASELPNGGHVAALFNCPYWGLATYNGRIGCTGFTNYTLGTQFQRDLSTCISAFSDGLGVGEDGLPAVDDLLGAIMHSSGLPTLATAARAGAPASINWGKVVDCVAVAVDVLDSKEHYACYDGSATQSIPFGILEAWNKNMTTYVPPEDPSLLYWLQGAWAEHTASVILGFLHGSSLLLDESRSRLNARLIQWASSPDIFHYYAGSIGINAVCDGGHALLDAMKTRLPTNV